LIAAPPDFIQEHGDIDGYFFCALPQLVRLLDSYPSAKPHWTWASR